MAVGRRQTLLHSIAAIISFFAVGLLVLCVAAGAQEEPIGDKACAVTEISRETLNNPCELNSENVDVELDKQQRFVCGEMKPLKDVSSKKSPKIAFKAAETGKSYAVLMLDPNAPNHGNKYWLHWLISDIKGEDLLAGNLDKATTITEYNPPTPPAGTGDHHYQFFIFELGPPLTVRSPARAKFDVVDFAKRNALCGPIAATQFVTHP